MGSRGKSGHSEFRINREISADLEMKVRNKARE